MAEVCFSCGYRDDIGDGDGCAPCREARAVDDYLEDDAPRIKKRRRGWGVWTQSADAARERQRRHRLLTGTKPREFAHPSSDPLELANEALEHLVRVRQALKSNFRATEHLDEAEELLKRLGWGPTSVPSLPGIRGPKMPPGRIGMHNRWHVKEGKPCNCPPALAEELRKKSGGKAASDAASDTTTNAAPTDGIHVAQEPG